MKFLMMVISTLLFVTLGGPDLSAQDKGPDDEPIYGRDLMTEQERIEYRDRMRAAKSVKEREQIRAEHHEKMKVRAKEQGVTLPDDPPERGMGRGDRQGPRDGTGAGKGERKSKGGNRKKN